MNTLVRIMANMSKGYVNLEDSVVQEAGGGSILTKKNVRSGGHRQTTREDKRPQGRTKRPQKGTKLKCPPQVRQNPVKSGHPRTRPFIQFQCVGTAL